MERKFSKSHEWVIIDGDIATIGISDYAQKALGDVVFVQLPDVGREIKIGESFAEVESVKAVSEVYSPVEGKVVEVNTALADAAANVNSDPYGSWFVKVQFSNVEDLMSEADYDKLEKK